MMFHNILITRMKFIGDVVLTTPLIRTLRDAYPEATITYLGDAKAVSLLTGNPYLDEIIPFDFSRSSLWYSLTMFRTLYSRKFDLVIDLYSNPRSAVLSFMTGAAMRIGGDARGRGKLYTHRVHDDGKLKSAIDYHYQSLNIIGVKPRYYKTEIFLDSDERKEAAEILRAAGADLSRKTVILHPGATWPNKIWLKESFRALSERFIDETDVNIILSPGPHDAELIRYIVNNRATRIGALPLLPVRKLAAVLSLASVFVSNDCGPMHIGAAVGTKTIGIFGPEPAEIWFPYDTQEGHLSISKKLFCSPCRTTHCYRTGSDYLECMKLITVDEVFTAVMERLK